MYDLKRHLEIFLKIKKISKYKIKIVYNPITWNNHH